MEYFFNVLQKRFLRTLPHSDERGVIAKEWNLQVQKEKP
jgi:hypothetical protein